MKKILMALSILAITSPVFADIVFKPEWKEFCPSQYANIDVEKDYKLNEKKYWADRKATFDKRISKCESLDIKLKEACYNKVSEMERAANTTQNEFKSIKLQEKSVQNQLLPKTRYIYHN